MTALGPTGGEQADPEGVAVGRALRRIRREHRQTQAACAGHLRAHGLPWSKDNVVTIENGRRETISVRELVSLSRAYGVPLSAWFQGPGRVRLSPSATMPMDVLRAVLRGGTPPVETTMPTRPDTPTEAVDPRSGDDRAGEAASTLVLARELDMSPTDAHAAATALWGHSLEKERDLRLGDVSGLDAGTVRARRGNMTRVLVEEARDSAIPGATIDSQPGR